MSHIWVNRTYQPIYVTHCALLCVLKINRIDRKDGSVILSNKLLVLIGMVSYFFVLLSALPIGGSELFKIDAVISISLGILALLITFFFVNQERTRKIKGHYFYKRELIHTLRGLYILLEQVKKNLCEIPDEKTGYSVKVIKESIKEIHFLEYWRMRSQFGTYSMYVHLDIEDKDILESLLPMDNFFSFYIRNNELNPQYYTWFHMGIQFFQEILDFDEFQLNGKRIDRGNRVHDLLGELVDTKVLNADKNRHSVHSTKK